MTKQLSIFFSTLFLCFLGAADVQAQEMSEHHHDMDKMEMSCCTAQKDQKEMSCDSTQMKDGSMKDCKHQEDSSDEQKKSCCGSSCGMACASHDVPASGIAVKNSEPQTLTKNQGKEVENKTAKTSDRAPRPQWTPPKEGQTCC